MPSIDDMPEVKKPFKKKAYRPWNLLDETPTNLPDTKLDFISQTDDFSEKSTDAFQQKIGNNKITNRQQLDNKLVNTHENNRATIKKPLANKKKSPHVVKKTISKRIDNDLDNALVNESRKKYEVVGSVIESVRRLTGHQRKLLIFIAEDCLSHGLLTTNYITNESLRILINTDTNSVKTSIQRLIEKGLIAREKGKRGNGGFTCYKITKSIRDAVIQEKQKILNSKQLGNALDNGLVNNSVTDKVTTTPSSSSFKELRTTTTEELANAENFDRIQDIDIEPLSGIGFMNYHLTQITSQNKLPSEMIQQSINAFAFDLTENKKTESIKGSPLNFFIGILRKGIPYLPPPNYEAPEDRAMRLCLERKKEIEKIRLEREEELLKMACGEWLESLSEGEKEALMPADVRKSNVQGFKMSSLRTYFKENLWAQKRTEFLATA